MLIGSCAHCSYLRSEGEKNLELLEICIIYSVFFLLIYLTCAELWKGKERMTGEWQIKATSEKAQFVRQISILMLPCLQHATW